VYKKSVPGVVLRITGGSMIQATRYNLERYRCNLCLATYTASLPDDVSIKDKYDAKAKAVVVVDRLQLGVAMYRRAVYQKQLELPLAESTQWGDFSHLKHLECQEVKQRVLDHALSCNRHPVRLPYLGSFWGDTNNTWKCLLGMADAADTDYSSRWGITP